MADFTGTRFRIDRQNMATAIPAVTTPPCDVPEHDAAVRQVLRMAASRHADVADVGLVCAVLGLSLDDALRRSEGPKP